MNRSKHCERAKRRRTCRASAFRRRQGGLALAEKHLKCFLVLLANRSCKEGRNSGGIGRRRVFSTRSAGCNIFLDRPKQHKDAPVDHIR
eukprot:scaffold44_cov339-Pavlova_lutheri.AAC.9